MDLFVLLLKREFGLCTRESARFTNFGVSAGSTILALKVIKSENCYRNGDCKIKLKITSFFTFRIFFRVGIFLYY